MNIIKQSYLIHAPASEVWKSLTNPKYINDWAGGHAKMSDKIGAKFSLWDGSIWGKNLEVVPQKTLIQEWYSDSENEKWLKPSIVTFELHSKKDYVRLDLIHKNVPISDIKSIDDGWHKYYLGPLKKYIENMQL